MCAIAAIGPSPGWLARACGVRGARPGGGGSSAVPTSAAGGGGSGARLGARLGASVTRRRGTASTRSSIWGKGSGWRSWSSACAHCSILSIMGSIGACACFCERRMAALRRPAVFCRAACVSSSAVGAALLSSYASRSMARSSSARKAGWPGGREEGGLAWGGGAGWAHQGAAPRSCPHLQEGLLPWRATGRVRIAWLGQPARQAPERRSRSPASTGRELSSVGQPRASTRGFWKPRHGLRRGQAVTEPARPRREERARPAQRRAPPPRLRCG